MATSFEVIFLGTLPLIDTTQGDEDMESPGAIFGTYGSTTTPLSTQIRNLTADRLSEDDNTSYDIDNSGGYDSFRINGGAPQNFDGWATYNALITYSDGSTATITAVVMQDVSGNTYLVPEQTNDADQAALTSRPIQSLTLQSVAANGGDLIADRIAGDFKAAVDGTAGNDLMNVGYTDAQGDQVTNGNDDIIAGAGNDTVFAGDGNDFINGGDGNDELDGGDGNDVILGGTGNDVIEDWIGDDLVYGGDGDDIANFSVGNDTLFMDAGNDTVNIWDNPGQKVVSGGAGTDLINFENWQSTTGATATFTSNGSGTFSHFNGVTTGTFTEIESLSGTANNDTFNAGATTTGVTLNGEGGNDTLTGGSGADTLLGGDGADVITANAGADTVDGGAGNDTIRGDAGDDSLSGGNDNDVISGGVGNDALQGDFGNDLLFGNGGNDTLTGGSGTDSLFGNDGADSLVGGEGDDIISGDSTAPVTVVNSNFENASAGWTVTNPSATFVYDNSMAFNASDQPVGGSVQQTVTTQIGQNYVLSLDALEFGGGVGNHTLLIEVVDSNGDVIATQTATILDGTTQALSIPFTSTTTNVTLRFSNPSSTATISTDLKIDNIAVTPVTSTDPGNDTLRGEAGNDILDAGAGNDLLEGGTGNDTLAGGAGTDRAVFTGPVTEYSFDYGPGGELIVTDLVGGRDGTDTLSGIEFATFNGVTYHLVTGDDGSNTTLQGPSDGTPTLIIAHDGNDWGGGHATSDIVFGGAGDDTLDGGDGNDTLVGEADNDLLRGDAGDDSLIGGTGNDTLQGGTGNDILDAGAGNDALDGGAGNDTLAGGAGTDRAVFTGPVTEYSFDYGPGGELIVTDLVGGRDGTDTLSGIEFATFNGVTYHLVTGDDGSNTTLQGPSDGTPTLIIAHDGNDWGGGHATSDIVFGGAGDDTLDGGDGNDTLVGEADNDLLRGDAGDDSLIGGTGNDTLQGGTGNDILDAGAGNDALDGGAGNDSLNAGSGNDVLEAGLGNDTLTTGDGADVVILTVDGGADRITDFNLTRVDGRAVDQIDVSELTNADGDPIRWRDVTVTDTNGDGTGDAVLTFANGESIILEGVSQAEAEGRQNLIAIGIPCFTSGTPILTPRGWVMVESLAPGDTVLTNEGPQRVLWSGHRALSAADLIRQPDWKPVHFPVGAIGNTKPLRLSPQHAVLMRDLFGAKVLVRAKHLAEMGFGGARVAQGVRTVQYHHILMERHAVLCAAGAPAESFYPGPLAMEMLDWPSRLSVSAAIGAKSSSHLLLTAHDLATLYGDRVHPLANRKALSGLTVVAFAEGLGQTVPVCGV